jgi:predicted amidohydrolase
MKIALMQLPWNYTPWSPSGLLGLLEQVGDVDLIVFPESMPFAATVTHEEAITELGQAGQAISKCTFISGGYVREGDVRRNRSYLTNNGKVIQWYDKQIRWLGERFKEGDSAELFEWEANRCVPLVCADAGDDLSRRKVKMMSAAIGAGAGPKVPIVISSYGGGLMTDYWQPALREWSKGCDAPVVICGISGWHGEQSYDYLGGKHPFGGGGSGVFWPDGYELQTAVEGIGAWAAEQFKVMAVSRF